MKDKSFTFKCHSENKRDTLSMVYMLLFRNER